MCNTIYDFKEIGKNIKFSKLPNLEHIFPYFNKLNETKFDSYKGYGEILVLFKKCISLREEFIPYIKFIGFIDYLTSVNTLINDRNKESDKIFAWFIGD